MDKKKINEEEESEKQKYINENIIDKGYNPDDLNAFIIKRRLVSSERISLEDLKTEIEAFKNEQLQDTYTTIKKTMPLTKKDEQLSELYSSEIFNVNYSSEPELNLIKLEKEGKRIKIIVSNGKFEKISRFFSSQMKFICNITCEELESNIIRSLDDIEWLKNQLNEKYPLIYIPPIYISKEKNKNENAQQQTRYITKFFDAVLRKKILRTSSMIYQFLILDNEKFMKYKDAINKIKFNLQFNMENFKSNKKNEEFQFSKQQIYLPEKYLNNLNLSELYILIDDLNKSLLDVSLDFKNLSTHTKELSNNFWKLVTHSIRAEQNSNIKDVLSNFRSILSNWSLSFEKQSLFFSIECKEFFNYINCELKELNNIYLQFTKFKEDYEKIGIQLLEKKEKLFFDKKYEKWELTKEDEKNLNEFKDDFQEAKKYMCKDFTELVARQKIRVACSCNIIFKEFKKLINIWESNF